jgi:uncharacterized phage-associated protein
MVEEKSLNPCPKVTGEELEYAIVCEATSAKRPIGNHQLQRLAYAACIVWAHATGDVPTTDQMQAFPTEPVFFVPYAHFAHAGYNDLSPDERCRRLAKNVKGAMREMLRKLVTMPDRDNLVNEMCGRKNGPWRIMFDTGRPMPVIPDDLILASVGRARPSDDEKHEDVDDAHEDEKRSL